MKAKPTGYWQLEFDLWKKYFLFAEEVPGTYILYSSDEIIVDIELDDIVKLTSIDEDDNDFTTYITVWEPVIMGHHDDFIINTPWTIN